MSDEQRKRYLIEEVFPIAEISKEAKREKAIRHGHISTLHVWWARRPLVVARAAVLGALLPAPETEEEKERMRRFMADLCKWEVRDDSPEGRYLLNKARQMIRQAYPEGPPKVLDSMAGGGSIPLEALRLGCEAYAVEYNPVAYLILKATVEYPQKYGKTLVEDVKGWGQWVLDRAREELSPYYPPETDGSTPVAYIWSRTVKCPGPACGAEIPLFRQFWLAKRERRKVALHPLPDTRRKRVEFEVLEDEELEAAMEAGFDPSQGTVSRANAVCLICGGSASDDYLRDEAEAHRMGHRLIAVISTEGRGEGKRYRPATRADVGAEARARQALEALKGQRLNGLSVVPDEPSPGTIGQGASKRPTYGLTTWGAYFNPRQALAMVTFARLVREAHAQMLRHGYDPEYAKAVATYLAFGVDFLANYSSVLSSWHVSREIIRSTFAGHHLHMAWDYSEVNPCAPTTGGFPAAMAWIEGVVGHCSAIQNPGASYYESALHLPDALKPTDAVVVDPPYYDNVPYSDLSDFYYIWLKRTLGSLYVEGVSAPLTPKDEEIVHSPPRWGGGKKGEEISHRHFERLLSQAFQEMNRVLRGDGCAVVMFTHKSTQAWEHLIESLLSSGLYSTASWPVHTEMEASTHTAGKGAIQSTILLALRKRKAGERVGWFQELRGPLQERIGQRLEEFWNAGIRGADFFVSAIGPAVEIFGQYERVLQPDGSEVGVGRLLDEVRALVAQFALERIIQGGVGEVDPYTRFYLLYHWAYGLPEVEFDEARKLAIAVGVEVDDLARVGLAQASKGKVRVLHLGRRDERSLERRVDGVYPLINGLHQCMLLWRRNDTEALHNHLLNEGLLEREVFWRTAQALSEVLTDGSEDKTILEQFLPARDGLVRRGVQRRMI